MAPHVDDPNAVPAELPADQEAIARIEAQLKGITITMSDESMPYQMRHKLAAQEAALILAHLDESDPETRERVRARLGAYGLLDPEPPR